MTVVRGVRGSRPTAASVGRVVCPPYDVIKTGTPLHAKLTGEADSMVHVTLGSSPRAALDALHETGALVADEARMFTVLEQTRGDERRLGVFTATEVSEYAARNVIRHEKTFDDKVRGRIALTSDTGHAIGPVFALTRGALGSVLETACAREPDLQFTPDFGTGSDLHGVTHRAWQVPEDSDEGRAIIEVLAPHPLYIADGHHRYHAALKGGLTHALAYVTEDARILAYDRVVKGTRPFSEVADQLELTPIGRFETPPKHVFHLFTREGVFALRAQDVPADVVGGLDCAILERELYPRLGLRHEHIMDAAHFDYYPESALDEMMAVVRDGTYDLAIALHPVSQEELLAVADAGLEDPTVVMPEKSTFFSPKIPTGLVTLRVS